MLLGTIINEYNSSYQGRARPFGIGWLTGVETVEENIFYFSAAMYVSSLTFFCVFIGYEMNLDVNQQ